MIKIRDYVSEKYFIDPETAVITDENGVEQPTYLKNGRMFFKGAPVYVIQMHTHVGYIKRMSVHHIDGNKLNDALSNLMYLTNSSHMSLHFKGKDYSGEKNHAFGKHWKLTEEQRKHQSEAQKRFYANLTEEEKEKRKRRCNMSGWHHTEETKQKLRELSLNNSAARGRHLSNEQKEHLSEINRGNYCWNNGKECIKSKECPGEGWVRGLLPRDIVRKRST